MPGPLNVEVTAVLPLVVLWRLTPPVGAVVYSMEGLIGLNIC